MRNKRDLEKLYSNLSIRISTKCTIQFAQSFSHFQFKIEINFDIGGGDPIAIGSDKPLYVFINNVRMTMNLHILTFGHETRSI